METSFKPSYFCMEKMFMLRIHFHSVLNSLEFKGGLAATLTIFTTFFTIFSNQFLCS